VFEVADPTRAAFEPLTGEPFRFRIAGLAAGTTSVVVRVSHLGHFDFSTLPIPLVVSGPLQPEALWLLDGCNPEATWNYDTTNGPGAATGPIWITPGGARLGLHVGFLSPQRDADGVRLELDPDARHSLAWSVSDPAVVQVTAAGDRFGVDMAGIATGSATVSFTLRYDGGPIFTSGGIPVVVAPPPAAPVPDLIVRKNGIWTVIVQNGVVVASACTRTADPGSLAARVGELTDLYSVRTVDGACVTNALSGLATLRFEFADPCIARVVNHPVHWGENLIFHVEGLVVGTTTLRITPFVGGVPQWTTPPLPVVISPAQSATSHG
jgi:hypothetical protein